MNNIILCEGKTDAILLSYYLGHTRNWRYTNKAPTTIPFRGADSEEGNWYKRNGSYLAIWAVGGQENFEYAINEVIKINKLANEKEKFYRIVILTDRDQAEKDELKLNNFNKYFSHSGLSVGLSKIKNGLILISVILLVKKFR